MVAVEQYLKPELAAQIKRLDLRAKMVVRGFLQGLHASPFHGFSVEFSEHRRYTPGDDPKGIDWVAYAKTGKYYIKNMNRKRTSPATLYSISVSRWATRIVSNSPSSITQSAFQRRSVI